MSQTRHCAGRTAIIVGGGGQDGRHLQNFLEARDCRVIGIGRGDTDITDPARVRDLVAAVRPDELYLLAAHHHSAESRFESDDVLFARSQAVHVVATVNFLEAIACAAPAARLFYASSSHIFPDAGRRLLDENSPPSPRSIYAITKYSGMLACRYYRERRGVFASCGILFNHESGLRAPHFLSRKITIAVARIAGGLREALELGNLDAVVDWGYAPDYVDAMYRILQLDGPDDFVVATGVPHTVRDFVDLAFQSAGLDYRDHIRVRPDLLTKNVETRLGDARRLREQTGWQPTLSFAEMVRRLVCDEMAAAAMSAAVAAPEGRR